MRVRLIALALAISGTVLGQKYTINALEGRRLPENAQADPGALPCTYLISVASLGMTAIGGNLEVRIVTGNNCAWSITGLPPWLTVSSSQGTGPADVRVMANNNAGGLRVGVFTVGGVSVPVRQFDSSACMSGLGCQIRPVPHVAFGGEWTTDLFAVSLATYAGDLSIAFYDDTGSPVALPFTGGLGNLNTLTDSVPAKGRKDYEASNASAPTQGGWALVTSDQSVETQAIFRRATANGIYYEAGVLTESTYSEFVIPFDATTFAPTGAPLYTGFAIVNMNPLAPAHVVCTARDQSGAVIPNALTIPTLNPMGHYADYLFPALTGKRGTLDCAADTLVSAIALRFIGTDAFSTLPVIVNDP